MRRLTLAIPSTTQDRLERLRRDTDAASIAGVIAEALRVYEFFMQQQAAGADVLIRKSGEADPVVVRLV